MSSEDAVAQSLKLKEAGNAAYKSRDFDTAIAKYKEAWEQHKDITYLNNLAGESDLYSWHMLECANLSCYVLCIAMHTVQLLSSKLVTMTLSSRLKRMQWNKDESYV